MIDTRMKCIRYHEITKTAFRNKGLQQNLNTFGNKFWVPLLILQIERKVYNNCLRQESGHDPATQIATEWAVPKINFMSFMVLLLDKS